MPRKLTTIRGRHEEILRQWRVLLALDHREWYRLTEIYDSMTRPRPHVRTIRRDLEVLSEVFEIERRRARDEGSRKSYFQWRLRAPLGKIMTRGDYTRPGAASPNRKAGPAPHKSIQKLQTSAIRFSLP